MRLLVQWTTATPQNWQAIDSRDWRATSRKPEPAGNGPVVPDNAPGWLHALCVQGTTWEGYDHVAVEDLGDGSIRIVAWCDDPEDWPPGQRWGRSTVVRPLAPDAEFNGAINTRMEHEVFGDVGILPSLVAALDGSRGLTLRPWSEFVEPSPANARHGAWVDDATHANHGRVRSSHGWRTWTEGLDPEDLTPSGEVRQQRPQGRYVYPKGTRTYFHSSTALPTPAHVATFENALAMSTAAPVSQTVSGVGATAVLGWVATTGTGEPGSAAWPVGTYRAQLDCTAIGVDLGFGLLTLGGVAGHFARLTSALAEVETKSQVEAAFTGAGLKLATFTGAWASGLASDRYEIAIVVQRIAGHGTQNITLQLNEADDFTDGPWAAAQAGNAVMFGTNM